LLEQSSLPTDFTKLTLVYFLLQSFEKSVEYQALLRQYHPGKEITATMLRDRYEPDPHSWASIEELAIEMEPELAQIDRVLDDD